MAERRTSVDATNEPREHGSPVVRALLLVAGILSLALGIAGIFLPVLPTTPLVILAAACFARSHRPFHEWLLAHRHFGPTLREWREHRSIPYRTKLTAIAMMATAMSASRTVRSSRRSSARASTTRPATRPRCSGPSLTRASTSA